MGTEQIKKLHFIGIGGVGMSGIAQVAFEQGMEVSGSDLKESRYTKQLRRKGIKVFIGQRAQNIIEVAPDVVVVSTAILDNNPELIQAKESGIPIWHRAKMLAALGEGKKTLAVAGTHGKTTSSSMLASVLDAMGCDPTFLIGGIVRAYHSNAHSGSGEYYVVEADESDKSFTYLSPVAVLVTNIEADHLDHYKNLDEIYSLFFDFMSSVPEDGCCVVCGEDEALVELARKTGKTVYTYGTHESVDAESLGVESVDAGAENLDAKSLGADAENLDVSAKNFDAQVLDYQTAGIATHFKAQMPDGAVYECSLKQNPGLHNALNAVGVLTLLWARGLDVALAAEKLSDFSGVRRRFDLVGEAQGVTIVDDYAHHPTEIEATITAAKALDFKRVQVIFQPHRYSRVKLFTEVLHDEFSRAFNGADRVTFMDVYPAGETPVPGVSGATFMQTVLDNPEHPQEIEYVERRMEVVPHVASQLEPGDLVITMGAGDVTAIGPELLAFLKEQESRI